MPTTSHIYMLRWSANLGIPSKPNRNDPHIRDGEHVTTSLTRSKRAILSRAAARLVDTRWSISILCVCMWSSFKGRVLTVMAKLGSIVLGYHGARPGFVTDAARRRDRADRPTPGAAAHRGKRLFLRQAALVKVSATTGQPGR